MKHRIFFRFCLGFSVLAVVVAAAVPLRAADPAATSAPTPAPAANTAPLGVGAIGRIEPRSRVLRLSHDQGPEGARIERVVVREGETVAAGATLVIFSDHARKQSELASAEARLSAIAARIPAFTAEEADARAEYRRIAALRTTAAFSQAAYDRALARQHKAAADLRAAAFDRDTLQAELQLARQKLAQSIVTAPLAGTVLKIHAWPGERVGDDPILEFADLTQMDIVAEVYENDIDRVAPRQQARVMLPGSAAVYAATVRERGFLVRKNDVNDTDPLADRDTRVVEVRLTLEDKAVAALRHQIFRQVQVQIQP